MRETLLSEIAHIRDNENEIKKKLEESLETQARDRERAQVHHTAYSYSRFNIFL